MIEAQRAATPNLAEYTDTDAYHVKGTAGAFFTYTSNAHSFDHFEPEEIRECHGNTELFQCSEPCSKHLRRAPLDT